MHFIATIIAVIMQKMMIIIPLLTLVSSAHVFIMHDFACMVSGAFVRFKYIYYDDDKIFEQKSG